MSLVKVGTLVALMAPVVVGVVIQSDVKCEQEGHGAELGASFRGSSTEENPSLDQMFEDRSLSQQDTEEESLSVDSSKAEEDQACPEEDQAFPEEDPAFPLDAEEDQALPEAAQKTVQQTTLESMKALKVGAVEWTKSIAKKGFTLIVGKTGNQQTIRAVCFVGVASCAVFGPEATGQALLGSVSLTWSLATGAFTATNYVANAAYTVYDYSNYIVGSAGYLAAFTQRSRVGRYADKISHAFSRVKEYVQKNKVKTFCTSVTAGATCVAYAPSGALVGTVAAVGSTVGTAFSLVTPFLPVVTGLSLGAGLDWWLAKRAAETALTLTKKAGGLGKRIVKNAVDKAVTNVVDSAKRGGERVTNLLKFKK
jgi:hypothetical protein